MSLKVLGLSASPRIKGNSDLLLGEALAGVESAGAEVERVHLSQLNIAPCVACGACRNTGMCRVQDDYQDLLQKMRDADRLIFATPIFFMAVPAQAKAMIDRCQCLWSRKYVLKQPLFDEVPRYRRGMVIAVGGCKSKKMFDSIRMTMKYYFDVLEIVYFSNLFVNGVDEKGAILKHPRAMQEARRLGVILVTDEGPTPGEPEDVELYL
ncbi:MAG: flavodoxin family protein [Planctomycetota bacterium]